MEALEKIDTLVKENPIIIFMKGSPQFPTCGFSSRTVAALAKTGEKFSYINVIEDQDIFSALPQYANWPTFPQVYISGELIGGCDITLELSESGELAKMMSEASASS